MEVTEQRRFSVGREFTAKAAKRLRGYLIRLTRGYTDGGMDSRAEENKGMQKRRGMFIVITSIKIFTLRKCSLRRPCIHG
jgi:hypothetical protein